MGGRSKWSARLDGADHDAAQAAANANAPHPIKEEQDRREGQHEQQWYDTHGLGEDRKSTRLNSSHANISYAVFCLKKKKTSILIYYFTQPYSAIIVLRTHVR